MTADVSIPGAPVEEQPAQVGVRARREGPRRTRSFVTGVAGVLALGVAWELYKAVAPDDGVVIGGVTVLPRANNIAMPHLWTMVTRALEPVNSAPDAQPLWLAVLGACAFSLGVAAVGWVVGVAVGALLAVVMQRLRTAREAILPWVVLSQTVPLIALAPLVRRWGAQLQIGSFDWQDWMSVAVIASYLAFFPVSIGALRGLSSPDAVHLDLMRAYGASWGTTLRTLRMPASVPYLLPALRLAAANAVVGTIVAEVSIGLRGGIGRMIVEFGASGSSDPAKQFAPIFGAVLVGLVAAGAVTLIGVALRRFRFAEVS